MGVDAVARDAAGGVGGVEEPQMTVGCYPPVAHHWSTRVDADWRPAQWRPAHPPFETGRRRRWNNTGILVRSVRGPSRLETPSSFTMGVRLIWTVGAPEC